VHADSAVDNMHWLYQRSADMSESGKPGQSAEIFLKARYLVVRKAYFCSAFPQGLLDCHEI